MKTWISTVQSYSLSVRHGWALAVLILVSAAVPVFAVPPVPPGSRVAVVSVYTASGDDELARAAAEVTRTKALVVDLLELFDLSRLTFLTPHHDLDRAALFLRSERFEYALYGTIRTDAAADVVELAAWRHDSNQPFIVVTRRVEARSELVAAGHDAVVELIEAFTAQSVEFAQLELINEGAEGAYSVYVDGRYVGGNVVSERIPAGTRRVEIFRPGRFGEEIADEAVLSLRAGENVRFSFSLADAADAPTTEQSTNQEEPMFGDLRVSATPHDAVVYVNDEQAGIGAVDLRRLPAGPYAIAIRHPAYVPSDDVVLVAPFGRTHLERTLPLDEDSPAVAAHLTPTFLPTLVSGLVTAAQVVYLGVGPWNFPLSNEETFPFVLVSSVRFGHFVAGDYVMGSILTAVTGLGLSVGYRESGASALKQIGFGAAAIGALYDVFFSGLAADRRNRRAIHRMLDDGVPSVVPARQSRGLYVTGRIGSGLGAGVGYRLLGGYVDASALVGVGGGDRGIVRSPIWQAAGRVTFHPLAGTMLALRPYVLSIVNLSTDAQDVRVHPGVGLGMEWVGERLILSVDAPFSFRRVSGPRLIKPHYGVSWRVTP